MKHIKLYVCLDEESERLIENVKKVISKMKEEPKIEVIQAKIKDPSKFQEYLGLLEEFVGGAATLEFRKYDITKLPAIVVDDEKIVEGHYPDLRELEELLSAEEVPIHKPIIEIRPPEVKPIEVEKAVSEEASEEASHKLTTEVHAIPAGEKALEEAPPLVSEKEAKPYETEELKPVAEREKREEKVEEIKPTLPSIDVSITPSSRGKNCLNCIFYSSITKRCIKLGIEIRDPSNPPCER
ncbi:MAG: hypothetical protein B6U94_07510 [Thermofilum sp. ex4484_79]|nr:MAG: hypothetical protein B6U94_07510 [Thermofilum sp. ex4484_79]